MGELTPILRKNENNTDTSFHLNYLPKLHLNILKYYWLNLFKEIALDFNYSLQTTLESPENHSDGLLV